MSRPSGPELLVVAGEASGDRIAALASAPLIARGARLWGVGGAACRAAGVELGADMSELAAMGLGDVARRLPALLSITAALLARVRRSPPRAALLVNFTELNQRLGAFLRRRGVRVLWCVAPQVWAWRAGRLRTLRGSIDRLAVILPFEEPLWRDAGFDVHHVGHPSLEVPSLPRAALRAQLGLAADARAVAVLPGSRPAEIHRLADLLAQAAARLRAEGFADEVRMILAPGLASEARALAQSIARNAGILPVPGDPEHGAAPLLGAFDLSLCASGTASLEAALAGAAPVVAYRLDRPSYALARLLVRTPHVALPNVLLGRRAYPELLQDQVSVASLAAAGRSLLAQGAARSALRDELRAILRPPSPLPFGERIAALMDDWLTPPSPQTIPPRSPAP